jgi:hypothetical protein
VAARLPARPGHLERLVPGAARRGGELMPDMKNIKHKKLLLFAVTVLIVLGIGTRVYIYYYPHLIYNAWDNAIVNNGDGATPDSTGIPINTLYTMTTLASPSTHNNPASGNHDTLYTLGVLDLSKGPHVLRVPDMDGRYYSVEFVDP